MLTFARVRALNFDDFDLSHRQDITKSQRMFYLFLPGGNEWILIFLAVLLLFGGRKIPELMRGLGKGIREFNSARASIETEIKEGMKEAERKEVEGEKSA